MKQETTKHRIYWADHVTTPEGYKGQVTEFDGEGNAKVYFDPISLAPFGSEWRWYSTEELRIG